jgi:hypothetical protein
MGNSTYTIQNLVDIARTRGDLAPALPTGGSYETVALSATNDAMTAMLAGNDKGSPFNFKFNRILITPFYINSYQQDYASPLVNLGWLESCNAYNTSSTQYPKPERVIEVRRDVLLVNAQSGRAAKISWMQNDTLTFGTWGQTQVLSLTGLKNPGPLVEYTDPAGATTMPANPITQVKDSFGNLWLLTTYGTCGASDPFVTNQNPNNLYPTFTRQTVTAPTVTDGSVVWTAINPKGQGFRINPMPTQTGPVWQVTPIGQARIPQFTRMTQLLEPIPDDYFTYFKDGFFAQCYRYHPDPKIRAKFEQEHTLWMNSLKRAVSQGSREEDDWGFVPGSNVMDTGWAFNPINPAMPYGPWAN